MSRQSSRRRVVARTLIARVGDGVLTRGYAVHRRFVLFEPFRATAKLPDNGHTLVGNSSDCACGYRQIVLTASIMRSD